MANALLDFVMAVVRDPQVAARYAADPAGALAAANLSGVTAADGNDLIPVVSDSIAMSTPAFAGGAGADVWTSGAATAAFDAFDLHRPSVAASSVISPELARPGEPGPDVPGLQEPGPVPDPIASGPDVADPSADPDLWATPVDWAGADEINGHHPHGQHPQEHGGPSDGDSPGFDLF